MYPTLAHINSWMETATIDVYNTLFLNTFWVIESQNFLKKIT